VHSISIIGLGRLGGALAIAIDRAGCRLDQLIYHSTLPRPEVAKLPANIIAVAEVDSIDSDVLLIATQDQLLRPLAEHLSRLASLPRIVLHLSGSLSSEVLESLRDRGVAVGSLHPLVSISDAVLGADRLPNAYFCVEGDIEAVSVAEELVKLLKGNSFTIESRLKPLYHAAAVMASGHITALFDAAIETLARCGLEPSEAKAILFPLLESTVANLRLQMPADALTGPFVRGDIEAFRSHIQAFEGEVDEGTRRVYLELAERSVRIAESGSATNVDRSGLEEAISMAKRKTEC